jgi:maltoporin
MGPQMVLGAAYDSVSLALTATVATAPGFAHVVVVYAPAGMTASAATLDGAPVTVAQDGLAVRVSFTGADAGTHALAIHF